MLTLLTQLDLPSYLIDMATRLWNFK